MTLALNTIHCGDALTWLRSLPDKCVDIIVTSPPYNCITNWSGGGPGTCMKWRERKQAEWYSDSVPEDEYQAQQKAVMRECMRVARGSVFYNHKIRYAFKRRGKAILPTDWLAEFPIWCRIIWHKGGNKNGNCRRVLVCDEDIYQIGRPHRWTGAHGLTSVWRIPPQGFPGHPCVFPVRLATNCIRLASIPGDTVCDPYMGSGTTAVAAVVMGRAFVGCEREQKYIDLAMRRLREEAGYQAQETANAQ